MGAKDVYDEELDMGKLQTLDSSTDVAKELKQITGIGDFASNNILHLMGYFNSHPYDTETVRLMKEDFGISVTTETLKKKVVGSPADKSLNKTLIFLKAKQKYERYEPYQFLAYWFDLWKNYERRSGTISTRWSIEQYEKERLKSVVSDHNQVFILQSTSSTNNKNNKNSNSIEGHGSSS